MKGSKYHEPNRAAGPSAGKLWRYVVYRAGSWRRNPKICFLSIYAFTRLGASGTWNYLSKNTWRDAMYLLHLCCPQEIFSHETALFFHDLTDREPLAYSIAIKTGYNPTRLKHEGFQVYTIKSELHTVGLTIYNRKRTICDVIRSRSHIEIQTFQEPLKAYARQKDKNLRVLIDYPSYFGLKKFYACIWRYFYDKNIPAAKKSNWYDALTFLSCLL